MINKRTDNLKAYICARDLYQDGLLFDANENPFCRSGLNRYPDPYARGLKKKLSQYIGLPQSNIFCGNGSDEIIDLLFRALVEPGENILINQPTYGMYQVLADINGIKTVPVPLDYDFNLNLPALRKKIRKNTKIIIACSPNNPTGNLLKKKDVFQLCLECPDKAIIIDEAYIEFSGQQSLCKQVKKYPNLIVLRTLSKAWGLAGLRLGYCLADQKIVAALNKVKPPYNISSVSQQLGMTALAQKEKMQAQVKIILRERKKLINELNKMNIQTFSSQANFILIKIANAACVRNDLAKNFGIIVRKINNYLRVTVGTPGQNKTLINALKKIL